MKMKEENQLSFFTPRNVFQIYIYFNMKSLNKCFILTNQLIPKDYKSEFGITIEYFTNGVHYRQYKLSINMYM